MTPLSPTSLLRSLTAGDNSSYAQNTSRQSSKQENRGQTYQTHDEFTDSLYNTDFGRYKDLFDEMGVPVLGAGGDGVDAGIGKRSTKGVSTKMTPSILSKYMKNKYYSINFNEEDSRHLEDKGRGRGKESRKGTGKEREEIEDKIKSSDSSV